VDIWTVLSDPKTGSYTHTVRGGGGHALLVPVVSSVFQVLGVSASLYDGRLWWAIHTEPNVTEFEVEHGVETRRWAYNGRLMGNAVRHARTQRGEHAGFCDLFVPVVIDEKVVAVLVAGPFAREKPDGVRILERWRSMTGRQGHLSDPQFSSYLRMTLRTLVLDGRKGALFEQLLVCLAKMIAGRGRADSLANEAHALRLELEPARFVDRTWEAVRSMIDERWSQSQYSASVNYDRYRLGLSRATDQVLVGLMVAQTPLDPVEDLVQRDAFQRASVTMAHEMGDMVSGKLGDHGVVVLSARKGSATQKRKVLLAFASRAAAVARQKYGLSIHFGASSRSGSSLALRDYQAALGAAESALRQGTRIVISDPASSARSEDLREMRDELARVAEEHPELLVARFDRYAEVSSIRAAYRIEPTRAKLEVAFERLADELSRSGALGPKSRRAMEQRIDRLAGQARTIAELTSLYRGAVSDLADAIRKPAPARRDRGLRGAVEYVHEHFAEPIALSAVARVAGFTPKYFSELFHKRERMTFAAYLAKLRLDRAKHLLSGTDLTVTRVAEASGYTSAQYFCRAFRRATGTTPLAFREELLPDVAKGAGRRGAPGSHHTESTAVRSS
jgi:AraC-like DNA-binding protein